MAITIDSSSQISITGGSASTPLDMLHLVTLSNWPAGTTQATVDSYIQRVASSYQFIIQSGKKILLKGYLNQGNAIVRSLSSGSFIHVTTGGILTGGRLVNGKVFDRATWIFDRGAQTSPHPTASDTVQSFLSGSGQINMVGLRIINADQAPGATGGHTGVVFWSDTGSFNLPELEVLCEGNVPTYVTFNSNNSGSSVSIKEIRAGTIRHSSTNVDLSFKDPGGGWIGGDNGSTKPKLLIPANQTTYIGLSPIFQNSNDILNITTKDFGSPSVIMQDAQVNVSKITMYPNSSSNRADVRRTLVHKPVTPSGIALNNVLSRAVSGAIEKINGIKNNNDSDIITVWLGTGAIAGTGDGTYLLPSTITDHRNISLIYRRADLLEATASTSGEYGSAVLSPSMAIDPVFTGTFSASSLITGISFSVNNGNVLVTITENKGCQDIYNYWKHWTSQPSQATINQNLITISNGNLNITGSITTSKIVSLNDNVTNGIVCTGTASITASGSYSNCFIIDNTGNTKKITGINNCYIRIIDDSNTVIIQYSLMTDDLYIRTLTGKTYTINVKRIGSYSYQNTFDSNNGVFNIVLDRDKVLWPLDSIKTISDLRSEADALNGYTLNSNGDLQFPNNGTLKDAYLSFSRQAEQNLNLTIPVYNGINMNGIKDASMLNGSLVGDGTLILTGSWTGSLGTVKIEDSNGVRVIIKTSSGGNFSIAARYGTTGNYTNLGYQSNVHSVTYSVPKGQPVEIMMWALGYVTYGKILDTTTGGTTFSAELIKNSSIDTTLDVSGYLANISLSIDTSGSRPYFVITFNSNVDIDGIELGKAIIHRLVGSQVALQSGLPPGSTSTIAIDANQITNNLPAVKLALGAGVKHVNLNFYIDQTPAKAIDPTYVINPLNSDERKVYIQLDKPDLDSSILVSSIKKVIKADLEIINNNVIDSSVPKPAKRALTA